MAITVVYERPHFLSSVTRSCAVEGSKGREYEGSISAGPFILIIVAKR